MKKPNPLIRFNNGVPIALCNRCFAIMCYVDCYNDIDNCKVTEIRDLNGVKYITTPIGDTPPSYCDACEILFTYSLNE